MRFPILKMANKFKKFKALELALHGKLKLICLLFLLINSYVGVQAATLNVQEFMPDSYQRIVQQWQGKKFILLIWSLECEYCQASLKQLAQQQKKSPQLHVVTLTSDNINDPQIANAVKVRLSELGIKANAWGFGDLPIEQLRYAIDPKWHGEMPRSYWFLASGQKKALSGVVDAKTVTDFLK